MERKPNRLVYEKSPYLLAHAYNPVEWYPWCDEAFEKAKREDKPVFLSIGYSSCHWCHVMEKESFEDEAVADILNRHFIPIKVDREERPDIDAVYMEVCLLFNGNGGWPLTVIMTPDKKPFFAGTYFPKETIGSRIGLREIFLSVAKYWQENREDLLSRGQKVVEYLKTQSSPGVESVEPSIIDRAFLEFKSRFDSQYGGFSTRPKFPSPQNLLFLMRYFYLKKDREALDMVEKTLRAIKLGGMYDHVGFGFHRYSTDRQWLLPHFEKMLYDQATLMMAYTECYQITKDQFYKEAVEETFQYLMRDMLSKEGGFYSSEDADSEGEEGKFYTWEYKEIENILGEDISLFIKVFNIKPEGNYFEEATGELTGRNILYLKSDLQTLSKDLKIDFQELNSKVALWKKELFEHRKKRVHPLKDDKILTDWNSLVMVALSKAGKSLKDSRFTDTAYNLFNFLKSRLFNGEKLYHLYKDGETKIEGMLDDYAFLVWGCIELYEATGNPTILEFAITLQNLADSLFYDSEEGGYYLSHHDKDLIIKPKPIFDGAYPSGNSVMINNLIKLYHITSDYSYYDRALKCIRFFSSDLERMPSYHSMSIIGLMLYSYPVAEVVLTGECKDRLQSLNEKFLPQKVVLYKDSQSSYILSRIAPYTESIPIRENCSISVCKNFFCNLPTDNLNYAIRLIEE